LKINYKIIELERTEDAPFVGALISACDCKFNCNNCFNQKVKDLITQQKEAKDIIKEIKEDVFNKGIIFGGLEWTLQIKELENLAEEAKKENLLTMLYTGSTFTNLKHRYGYSLNFKYFDYIKCGQYDENLSNINHVEYGVTLASENQHIYKFGINY